MVCIWEKFRAAIHKDVSLKAIWDHLKSMYDLMTLVSYAIIISIFMFVLSYVQDKGLTVNLMYCHVTAVSIFPFIKMMHLLKI